MRSAKETREDGVAVLRLREATAPPLPSSPRIGFSSREFFNDGSSLCLGGAAIVCTICSDEIMRWGKMRRDCKNTLLYLENSRVTAAGLEGGLEFDIAVGTVGGSAAFLPPSNDEPRVNAFDEEMGRERRSPIPCRS